MTVEKGSDDAGGALKVGTVDSGEARSLSVSQSTKLMGKCGGQWKTFHPPNPTRLGFGS